MKDRFFQTARKAQEIITTLNSEKFAGRIGLACSIFSIAVHNYKSLYIQEYKNVPPLFPLELKQASKEISIGILLGILSIPINVLLCEFERKKMEADPKNEAQINEVHRNEKIKKEMQTDYLLLFVGAFLQPISEEINYRGYLLNHTSPPLIAAKNLLLMNTCFSLSHSSGLKLNAFFIGLEYSILKFLFKGSIWSGTAAHITNNCIAYLPSALGLFSNNDKNEPTKSPEPTNTIQTPQH